MNAVLVPCSHCRRHVRATESSCPFCATALSPAVGAESASVGSRRRLGSLAVMAFRATALSAAMTACGGKISDSSEGADDSSDAAAGASGSGGGGSSSGGSGTGATGGSGGAGASGGSTGTGGAGATGGSTGTGGAGATGGGTGTGGAGATGGRPPIDGGPVPVYRATPPG